MEGRELRRSYTQVEFPVRSRQDYNNSMKAQQVRSKKFMSKSKFPTMEIYRPPGQRTDSESSKLNVNAKEFVMTPVQPSLQTSKSTGNVLLAGHQLGMENRRPTVHFQNSPVTRNGTYTTRLSSVQARLQQRQDTELSDSGDKNNNKVIPKGSELKRSKSMVSAHHVFNRTDIPQDLASLLDLANRDPNLSSTSELIELAKLLIEKATDNRAHSERIANACALIIEREAKVTFLEALLNFCQFTLEKKIKSESDNSGNKYYGFIAFLSHLYSLVKRLSLSEKYSWTGAPPNIVLLYVLVQCCQDLLKAPLINHRQEIECLFFVVTTIGKDLESEIPRQLESLMTSVRDAFIREGTPPEIRKTLIQLVEMRANHWQLPAYTVAYYKSAG